MLKEMIHTVKLTRTLRQLRKRVLAYREILSDYDCSANVAEYLNPQLLLIKIEVVELWHKAHALDPDLPELPAVFQG